MSRSRAARLALVLLLAVSSTACMRLLQSYDLAPNGLTRSDDGLRRLLVNGQADAALARLGAERTAPTDELLRLLYLGASAHYAGRHADSNAYLHAAAELADDRITRSISRSALALVSSDRVQPYEPGRTERLLIPYYAALNYLQLADLDGAVVEARRLAFLLQQYETDMVAAERPLHAMLRELAGTIFEAAGEHNDADVAYRNATALGRAVERAAPETGGSAFVIIEHGFVAHRVEAALNVMLLGAEVEQLAGGSSSEKTAAAALVAARILEHAAFAATDPYARRGQPTLYVPAPVQPSGRAERGDCEDTAECDDAPRAAPYLLRAAWPTYRSDTRPGRRLQLFATPLVTIAPLHADAPADAWLAQPADDDAPAARPALSFADVSSAVIADFERIRTAVMARTVARGVAKLAITRGAERRLAEHDESAGRLVGIIGNAGGALLEQADTRSWHLLPGGIALVRVPLAAGTHRLRLDIDGRPQPLDLGEVEVGAGAMIFLSTRAW